MLSTNFGNAYIFAADYEYISPRKFELEEEINVDNTEGLFTHLYGLPNRQFRGRQAINFGTLDSLL